MLQVLLDLLVASAAYNGLDKARQSAEPVFTFAEDMTFHNFHSVFRTGMVDPAVLNAVMLTFTFAVTDCIITRECLRYQGQALSHIRQKMTSLDQATSESTIGAILLLAGVEVFQAAVLMLLSIFV